MAIREMLFLAESSRQFQLPARITRVCTRLYFHTAGMRSARLLCLRGLASKILALGLVLSAFTLATTGATPVGAAPETRSPGFRSYGPYELPIPDVADISLKIVTDIGILIPEFEGFSRTEPSLLMGMAHGSKRVRSHYEKILAETGWGHVVPYIYSAAYSYLGRLYYGISSSPVMADGNPLLPKATLTGARITIRLVSDPGTWQVYLQRIGHTSAAAYWDAKRFEVGMFIDRKRFRWAGYQSKWEGRSKETYIALLNTYITRLVIRNLGHELFHAIQQQTDEPMYTLPLLAEGAAFFSQQNVFMREETVLLSATQSQINQAYNIDSETAIDCIDRTANSSPWIADYFSVGEIFDSYTYVKSRPRFSLTKLLSMDAHDFYSAAGSELKTRYSIALSTYWFLNYANSETIAAWNRVLEELLKADRGSVARKDAIIVDREFVKWLDLFSRKWWSHPNAKRLYDEARSRQTMCLNALQLIPAWTNAVIMAAYWPGSPTAAIYVGDIFRRINQPYLAYDYYSLTEHLPDPRRYGEYESRIKSRLADALEEIGDIDSALRLYKEATEMPLESPALFGLIARSLLKYEYYRLTQDTGQWRAEKSRLKLNEYVRSLQAPEVNRRAQDYANKGDWGGYINVLADQYNIVLARMTSELTKDGN